MPLSNPGTLKPDEYAKVIAFLLASNCYPPGPKDFPKEDLPEFKTVNMGPVDGAMPTDTKHGVCEVK
jgi:polar amino acid transport system substrate-binding protein